MTHRDLYSHTHPHHHAHAHHRQAFAYSHSTLCNKHEDHMVDDELESPHNAEACTVSVLDVARERIRGDHFTSVASNDAIKHRQTMNRHYTSMYTQELLRESQLDASLVWNLPASGEVSADAILSANSALPEELQTH